MSRATPTGSPLGYALRGPLILLLVVVTLYLAQALLIPIAFALTLTFLVAPATARLERRQVPRAAAVGIVSAMMCGCILLGSYVVSRQLVDVAQTLPGYRTNVQRRVAALHSPAEATMARAAAAVEEMSGDFVLQGDELRAATSRGPANSAEANALPVRVVDGRRGGLAAASDLLVKVVKPVGEIGIVLIFTIYMLMKREELRHRLLLLAGMGHINLMSRAIEDATSRVSRYLIMQIEVNACYGLFFGAGLFLAGVPNATLWGVIAGSSHCAVCGHGGRADPAADRVDCDLARLVAAGAGAGGVFCAGDYGRELCRAVALQLANGDFVAGAAGDGDLLDDVVGLAWPGVIDTPDGLHGGDGAVCAADGISEYSAGDKCGVISERALL